MTGPSAADPYRDPLNQVRRLTQLLAYVVAEHCDGSVIIKRDVGELTQEEPYELIIDYDVNYLRDRVVARKRKTLEDHAAEVVAIFETPDQRAQLRRLIDVGHIFAISDGRSINKEIKEILDRPTV